jgi:hypothetical protein
VRAARGGRPPPPAAACGHAGAALNTLLQPLADPLPCPPPPRPLHTPLPPPPSWGDSVEKACQAGVAAIAHPGGSMRDSDAVECCDKYGVVLVTTGVRHFKH